jgi:hypothetical protein
LDEKDGDGLTWFGRQRSVARLKPPAGVRQRRTSLSGRIEPLEQVLSSFRDRPAAAAAVATATRPA